MRLKLVRTFFLRVSARCNMTCDYCYVFKHRDQSWKKLPPTMDEETIVLFSKRVKEYVLANKIEQIYIIYHGGEPLILGESILLRYTDLIKSFLDDIVLIDFSIQTNGTLINKQFLNECQKRNIGISISIDGPFNIHNKHRKMKNGNGSYELVVSALRLLLKDFPDIFQGAIGVIDPYSNPKEILEFFERERVYNIDLLLPDATYDKPPKDREFNPNLYKNWLIEAFDMWFDSFQNLSVRSFEYILQRIIGQNVQSDFLGFGELSYLTIETDGTYHTSDILKITYEDASAMGISLKTNSIEDAISHPKFKEYNKLLAKDNLPGDCKICNVVDICGGGSLPHRYSHINGFNNPTVYCNEMKSLILHAQNRLLREIECEIARSKCE